MNRHKDKQKIWAGIFVATMMVSSMIVATATVKADLRMSQKATCHPVPPVPPSYQVIWGAEYPDGLYPADSVADKNNDVIIGGMSQTYTGLLVKYNGVTGDVVWSDEVANALQSPGQNQNPLNADLHTIRNLMVGMNNQRFRVDTSNFEVFVTSVDVDSHNDVYVVAIATDISQSDYPQDTVVAKYNSEDGALIWEKYITFYTYDNGMGITVDSNDNVIVAGVSGGVELQQGNIIPIMDAWMYKLAGSDGHMLHMDHVFGIAQTLPYYLDVDADSQSNYFATGPALNIDWSNFPHNISTQQTMFLNKHNAAFHLDKTYLWPSDPYTFLQTICVDSSDFVYVGGWINTDVSREYIVKFYNALNSSIWTVCYDPGWINKLASTSNGKIVAAAYLTSYDGYMTTELFNTNNGRHYFRINEAKDAIHDAYAWTVAVDHANDIITSGERIPPDDWYTMKYHITPGSGVQPESQAITD